MRVLAPTLLIVILISGCETPPVTEPGGEPIVQPAPQPAIQPAVNVGIGVGSGGARAYGGVGFYQGPFSVFLGF